MIVDAGVLYSAADAADPDHDASRRLLAGWEGELVVPAFVATEADHLILGRLGVDAQLAFVADLAGAYTVDALDVGGLRAAETVCRRYRDLELGLADASIVVLAQLRATRELATFDERDFRAVTPLQGGAFELHP